MMTLVLKTSLVLAAVALLVELPASGGAMPEVHPDLPDLSALAQERTLKITTTGRKSGKLRTAEIWFVVEGDHVFVQAGKKARKGWLPNLRSNPQVGLDIGGVKLRGRATEIAEPLEAKRVLSLIRDKYWFARVAGWFGSGIGAGVPVRIDLEAGP